VVQRVTSCGKQPKTAINSHKQPQKQQLLFWLLWLFPVKQYMTTFTKQPKHPWLFWLFHDTWLITIVAKQPKQQWLFLSDNHFCAPLTTNPKIWDCG
jgi:hypothetical protein